MKLYGETITEEDILEMTFSTFHASNVLLQQQYRERGFTEYNQLISMLLVAEKNNELLMKNHQFRPTGSAPFPEVNAASIKVNATSSGSYIINEDVATGEDSGTGREIILVSSFTTRFQGIIQARASKMKIATKAKAHINNAPRNSEGACYRCGGNGH
ncbi:hypothetical protein ACFXTN_030988 [Malus domestica]